jgi:hypothetical protein
MTGLLRTLATVPLLVGLGAPARDVPYARLRERLLADGQVLDLPR